MLGTIPCSALFILFDFVVHNPTHPETEINLSLMDVASGYFSRLQYATGDSLPSSMMSGFSHIATEFVRKTRLDHAAFARAPQAIDLSSPRPEFHPPPPSEFFQFGTFDDMHRATDVG
jgi:hypothetical protein